MEATSEGDNILGLRKKDLSLIRHSLEAGGKLIHQVIDGLKHGTSEVQHLILQQSDVILECRVCRNLFRSLPNYLDHKRFYCRELFPNESVSLLASPFADEVPIIYPEPPDDAKEFVEMSDLMSQFNKNKHLEPTSTESDTPSKAKVYIPNLGQSICGTLEKSRKKKPKPLYLKPLKETKVAMQLVPLSADNTSRNRNPTVFAGKKIRSGKKMEKRQCTGEHRIVDLSLIKLADFKKLLCLKCNYTYKNKKRLTYHINKFHIKKCHGCKEDEMCVDKTEAENNNRRWRAKQNKECADKKIDLKRFSTKSGHPSLKKFSYLAKKSTLVKNADLKSGWCRICNHSYSGKRGLIFHMFRMHSGSRKIYPCPLCNMKFPSLASALRHTQIVHSCKGNDMKSVVRQLKKSGHVENQQLKNMLEPEIKVQKCDSQINKVVVEPSPESVSDPVQEKDNNNDSFADSKRPPENSNFKCQECYQEFEAVRGLNLHMTRKHPDIKNEIKLFYTCHICLLSFFTNFSLKKHLQLKHNIQENAQENTTEIESKSDLKVATEPISQEGTSEYLLDKNIIVYNNKKYRIPIKYYKTVCKFASFPSLCLECNQKFVDARKLIRHIIRLHCTYKNAFPCPFCHMPFISSLAILRHTKVQHSCTVREIAELNRKLKIWEQQKNENADSKIKKATEKNNVPSEEGDNNDKAQNESSFQEVLTIHDVTDFQTTKCLRCKKKLYGFQGLSQHIKKAHAMLNNQKHKCLICNESFDKILTILKHVKAIHKPKNLFKPKTVTSSEVDRTAGSSSPALPEVVEPIKAPEKKQTELDSCKFKSGGEEASNSQLVMQCADFTKSSCLRCSEIFTGNRSLIAHIYKAHAHHNQTYSCYICLQTFKSYAIASQHTRNSHIYKGSAMMYVKIDSINEETSAGKNDG